MEYERLVAVSTHVGDEPTRIIVSLTLVDERFPQGILLALTLRGGVLAGVAGDSHPIAAYHGPRLSRPANFTSHQASGIRFQARGMTKDECQMHNQ